MIRREYKTFGFCCGLGGGAKGFKKAVSRMGYGLQSRRLRADHRLSILNTQLMRSTLGVPFYSVGSRLEGQGMLDPLQARFKEIVRLAWIPTDPSYLREHQICLGSNNVKERNRNVVMVLCLQHSRGFHYAKQVFSFQFGQPWWPVAFCVDPLGTPATGRSALPRHP